MGSSIVCRVLNTQSLTTGQWVILEGISAVVLELLTEFILILRSVYPPSRSSVLFLTGRTNSTGDVQGKQESHVWIVWDPRRAICSVDPERRGEHTQDPPEPQVRTTDPCRDARIQVHTPSNPTPISCLLTPYDLASLLFYASPFSSDSPFGKS